MQISIPVDNSNPGVCRACGGQCCTFRPGITDPSDWGKTKQEIEENIEKALRTGYWCIDLWDGDPAMKGAFPEVYMVRPNGKAYIGTLYHTPYYEAVPCAFLTETGCFYSFKDRPLACRLLIPNPEEPGNCSYKEHDLKRKMAIRWIPYNQFLKDLVSRLEDEKSFYVETIEENSHERAIADWTASLFREVGT